MLCAEASWSVVKGINATLENIANVVYICYNSLVLSIKDTKSDASVNWYNKEIYTCLTKVKKTLDHENFTLPTSEQVITTTEIVSTFKNVAKHSSLTCELLHALEALFMCAVVIFGLKSEGNTTTLNSLDNDILSKTVPVDCSIQKDGKCKWSLKLDTTIFQNQKSQNNDGCSTALNHFKTYATAFSKYTQQDYNESIVILHQFLKLTDTDTPSLFLANVYNLLGCSYANLGSLHPAIVYLRKAIQCSNNDLACHLQNVIVFFSGLGKWDAAMQTAQLLLVSFEHQKKERSSNFLLISHSELHLETVLSSNLSHWGFPKDMYDFDKALYLAGSVCLRANCTEKATDYYEKLLANRQQMMALQTNYHWYIPSIQQITAEREMALCNTVKTELFEFEIMRNELTRLSSKLNNIILQSAISCGIEEMNEVGEKLYHYICYTLYQMKRFVSSISHISELSNIKPLIEWDPIQFSLPESTDIGTSVQSKAASTIAFLNAVQAKFLLNKTIIMIHELEKNAEIFKLLQRVLKLAHQDIEIRWKLTLLLWKLGHKNEACKTWLKTRALDHRMTPQEIKALVSERSKGETEYKKSLYRRDVAILKEVYKSHLQH